MSEFRKSKTPWPFFGGKTDAAPHVWQALGDVAHYVEPFFGSGAVLLLRPHLANRTYYSETVNDLDGLLVNAWRSIQFSPQATAEAASWPVAEFDKHARGCYLLQWRESEAAAHLAGDPTWHDPIMAGWWMWCVCAQIGAWGQGGPWWPDNEGKLRKRPRGWQNDVTTETGTGVPGDLPHLTSNGRGVNRPQMREAGTGVPGDLPHLGNDGRGVNRPQMREAGTGVPGDRPHLGDDGMGVNRPQMREAGLTWEQAREADYQQTGGYHPITMPRLREWFAFLSARLRHVRIVNGDWTRVVTRGAAETLPVRQGKGHVGIFLDPPYGDVGRVSLYGAQEDFTVAAQVRQWCLQQGDNPKYRIIYAGFDEEGQDLLAAGWSEIEWFKTGFLKGGMGHVGINNGTTHQQHRERLWLSPHCITQHTNPQGTLFDMR